MAVLVAAGGCVARAPQVTEPEVPAPPPATAPETPVQETPALVTGDTETPTESLLGLVDRVLESHSADQRTRIEQAEKTRFEEAPSDGNLLRLTMVRALSAALPAELKKARRDLETLVRVPHELSDSQRYLAVMALVMVDQRLRMGTQITDLQQQIDSLTEIEASLKDNDADTASGETP